MPIKTICLTFAVLLVLFAQPHRAAAQVSGQPYRITDREVQRLLDRIKNKTYGFRKALKNALNKSSFDKTNREDNINAFVKEFEEETKRLDNHFDDHKSTTTDVDSVLRRAARIDSFMTRRPLDTNSQTAWATLRADLELLANAYNVSWRWGEGWNTPVSNSPYRIDDREVEQILKRIEKQSDVFRKNVDSALDKSRFDGSRREDDINSFLKEFSQETKRLRDHFNDHKATATDVRTVLERAEQIDQFMRRDRLRDAPRTDWMNVRAGLDELARVYNVDWRWRG